MHAMRVAGTALSLALLLTLASCKAALPDGVFVCTTDDECPDGFSCRAEGADQDTFCYSGAAGDGGSGGAGGAGGVGGSAASGSGGSSASGGGGGSGGTSTTGGSGGAGGSGGSSGSGGLGASGGDGGSGGTLDSGVDSGASGGSGGNGGGSGGDGGSGGAMDAGGDGGSGGSGGAGGTTTGGNGGAGGTMDAGGGPPWVHQFGTGTNEFALGAVTDSNGNLYVAGETNDALLGASHHGGKDAFLVQFTAAGEQGWVRQIGTGNDDQAWELAKDDDDNLYVTGFAGGGLHMQTPAGNADFFVTKYDASGMRQWTRQHGTDGYDISAAVAVDGDGNVYLAGRTDDAFATFTNTGPGGTYDIVLVKYDTAGYYQWTQQIGTSSHEEAYAVAADPDGNVYVGGLTRGNLDDKSNDGGDDAFVLKYSSAGTLLWSRLLGTGADEEVRNLIADATGVYVIGPTGGDLGGEMNAGDLDQYLARLDSDGDWLWTTLTGGPLDDDARGAVVDASGNIYITGGTYSDLDGTNAGMFDMMVTKYDANGNLLWLRRVGTPEQDEARALALDPAGGVWVTGNTEGEVEGEMNAGGRDVVLFRYDEDGNRK